VKVLKDQKNGQKGSAEQSSLPGLEGLSKADLVLLYGVARNRQLKKGDPVLTDNTHCCLIVKGSVGMGFSADGGSANAVLLGPGSWIGASGSSEKPWSFNAQESTSVLELSPGAFQTLPDKVQLALTRSQSDSANRLIAFARTYSEQLLSGLSRKREYIDEIERERRAFASSRFVLRYLAEIPHLPPYATDLAVKLLYDDAKVQEVVEGIRQDPSLASLVLKTVNSSYYSLPNTISDYYRACLLLGFNSVYRLVMEIAVVSIMPDTEEFRAIQQKSFLVSLIAQEIANRCKKTEGPFAATAGLLHDIGRGAVFFVRTKHPEISDITMTLDHAKVGACLLHKWGLPDRLVGVIENQPMIDYASPEEFPAELCTDLCVLGLAKAYAGLLLDPGQDQQTPASMEALLRVLAIDSYSYLGFYRQLILPTLADQKKCLPESIKKLLPES
jgi:putative nucleotidyltransferase with HDIG domain